MRRLIAIVGLTLLPLLASAQSDRPEWCDATSRQVIYPDHDYFVGFASGFARQGESIENAIARLKTEAQSDAAQHIQVHVQSASLDAVESAQVRTAQNFDEVIRSNFKRATTTYTDMEIPNLQSKSWSDIKSREVDVVVYVKRRDFMRYFDRQVESLLGKLETALETVQQQEQQGSQIKGHATAEEALKICPQVEYAQRMVALADPEASMEDLQMPRYTDLVKQLAAAIARLRHATAFFIDCAGTAYPLFNKEIRGILSEKGCQFTNDRESADWVVDIDANVINTIHNEGMPYFVYVDGTLSVLNGKTGQKVLEGRLSTLEPNHYDGIKGSDFSTDRAERIAYRETARIVANAILKLVQE